MTKSLAFGMVFRFLRRFRNGEDKVAQAVIRNERFAGGVANYYSGVEKKTATEKPVHSAKRLRSGIREGN